MSINSFYRKVSNNKCYSNEEKLKKIKKWIFQFFESLDILFESIQFHHCDPKAAQILLDQENAILADLDKTTFSLRIDGFGTFRIICAQDSETTTTIVSKLSGFSKFLGKFLTESEMMRIE